MPPLYPLRFEPIYQYRVWGARHLAKLMSMPLPEGLIGEAWLLSDREDHPSLVAEGPLKGATINELMKRFPGQILGDLTNRFERFPLLLKFLDAHEMLSVQVHPKDSETKYIPKGESGKTEAWVVVQASPKSRIYAGLRAGATKEDLRERLKEGKVEEELVYFTPTVGEAILLAAGTVHSLGKDLVVFEVQENSDVTFRLYDWQRIDPKTGKQRDLHVEQALACIDYSQGTRIPHKPSVEEMQPVLREMLLECPYFKVRRVRGEGTFTVGAYDKPRILVCLEGDGVVEHKDEQYSLKRGGVILLPSAIGASAFHAAGPITLLDISIPIPK